MKLDNEILKSIITDGWRGRQRISKQFNIEQGSSRVYAAIAQNIDQIHQVKQELNILAKSKGNRVLVIGDLHQPFTLDGYLEFCIGIRNKYQCNKIIFIGDVQDAHFSSYHETNADGDSAGLELEKAERQLAEWYKAFPEASVCLGNHDLIPLRKAQTSGLSSKWIKGLGDVLGTPNWTYAEDFEIDGVLYTHGVGRKARARAKNDMISIVQGHYHSESYIEHFVGLSSHVWAMQVGSGIDRKSYAMAYGKHFNKPHINCGVILENGTLPILEYMKL
jgi:predicted phosphodiesterase